VVGQHEIIDEQEEPQEGWDQHQVRQVAQADAEEDVKQHADLEDAVMDDAVGSVGVEAKDEVDELGCKQNQEGCHDGWLLLERHHLVRSALSECLRLHGKHFKKTWGHLSQSTHPYCRVLGQQDCHRQLPNQVGHDCDQEQCAVPQVRGDELACIANEMQVARNKLVLICDIEDADLADRQLVGKGILQV
jgi:hypothetical protein